MEDFWVDVPPVMEVRTVAELLSVSSRTVYRWIRSGQLPVARFGPRQMRITREDLGKFVEAHKGTGSQ